MKAANSRAGAARSMWLRRRFLGAAAALAASRALAAPAKQPPLRIGTTAVILDDQLGFLHAWRDYLQPRLGRPVAFIQRGSYREITSLLAADELDFAWICGYPYVRNKAMLELVALPNFAGKPLYRSYLIVPASDGATRDFSSLSGKVFAYSDPDSNSGFLVPQYEMLRAGIAPQSHFRKAFFTYAHRNVVRAVAEGLANGGAVDGYVWETLALRSPQLTSRTRVAHMSAEYGFPPIVARRSIEASARERFRHTLLAMSGEPEGRRLLAELNLEGFLPPDEGPFAGIAQAFDYVVARERLPTQS